MAIHKSKSQKPEIHGDTHSVLQGDYEILQQENKQLVEQLQRLQAEFQNYQKHVAKEQSTTQHYLIASFVQKLLPVLEDLHRFVQHHTGESVHAAKMITTALQKLLAEEGLQKMDCIGKQFDPYFHEVVGKKASTEQEGTILEVVQEGYLFKGKLLRNARVIISGGT